MNGLVNGKHVRAYSISGSYHPRYVGYACSAAKWPAWAARRVGLRDGGLRGYERDLKEVSNMSNEGTAKVPLTTSTYVPSLRSSRMGAYHPVRKDRKKMRRAGVGEEIRLGVMG
jgi:hypothetical protein